MATVEFLRDGRGLGGKSLSRLIAANGDPNALRPYQGDDGNCYTTVYNSASGRFEAKRIDNDVYTLPYRAWILLDAAVQKSARLKLRFVNDLVTGGLRKNIPNGLAHPVIQYPRMYDFGRASIAMDPIRRGPFSRPTTDFGLLPQPVIFEDFQFSWRDMLIASAAGLELDTTAAEMAAFNRGEEAEKLALGVSDYNSYAYAGGTIYGLTNEPNINLKTLTDPTSAGWTPNATLSEVLAMKDQLRADRHTGPYRLYASAGWDPYLDEDFSAAKGDNTLRERLGQIDQIQGPPITLDYLTGLKLVLIQWTPNVIQETVGMDWSLMQWDEQGGTEFNMKLMGMFTPLTRADPNGNSGICYGAVP